MSLLELFNAYLGFLWETFNYDLEVFSQGWIYYLLLIPAMGYFMFFILKWTILLIPLYMPLTMILRTLLYIVFAITK